MKPLSMTSPRILHLTPEGIRDEMAGMGVHPRGIEIMEGKTSSLLIRLESLNLKAALILKQDMLSLGGEVALSGEAAGLDVPATPALIMGTPSHITRLIEKMGNQPFGLADLAASLRRLLENLSAPRCFRVNGENLLSGGGTLVMGILNVTPDSFSDGGEYLDSDRAVSRGIQMVDEGAVIVDVGGESTRPGAPAVDTETELARVLPVIEGLVKGGVRTISIDTTKSEVARRALDVGAGIVNDISGMNHDPQMARVAAETGASIVLMHTRGTPETMQRDVSYSNLMGEVFAYLDRSVEELERAGVPRERACVDPGIGFGKLPEHNVELIARVGELKSLGTAVMVGASRKSFIGHYLHEEVGGRLEGSLAAAAAAALRGADIIRCHDVAQTVKALRISDEIGKWVN